MNMFQKLGFACLVVSINASHAFAHDSRRPSQKTVDVEIQMITEKAKLCNAANDPSSMLCNDFRDAYEYVFGKDARKWFEFNFERNFINSSNASKANLMIEESRKAYGLKN